MRINRSVRSPNFSDLQIAVEFVVLHYSAAPLMRTLEILSDPRRKVSSHFVVAEDGEIFELVTALDSAAVMAYHAGRSKFAQFSEFNQISIGIELINLNGNLFPYSDAQYDALSELISALSTRYQALRDPNRIVGHEQISGYRGKIDPGMFFDWPRFFRTSYQLSSFPERVFSIKPSALELAKQLAESLKAEDFEALNALLELASTSP